MHLGARKGPPGGSGTAGAVGTKHGRAMLCGPSWCGEQERPLPVPPPLREYIVFRYSRSSRASRSGRRYFSPETELWNLLVQITENEVRAFRLAFCSQDRDLSLSLFRNVKQFRRCTPYFGRKACGGLRVSFFLSTCERNNKRDFFW